MTQDKKTHPNAWRAVPWEEDESDQGGSDVAPLTAQEAAQWRLRHRALSPWRILTCQAVAALVGALLIWIISQESVAIISWLYGAVAIILPAVFFARAIVRRASLGTLVLSEMAKLLLSVVLIAISPWLLDRVAWWPLLLAIVLTVNVYWIAPLWLGALDVSNK